jgi:hypothetical protein
MVFIVVKKKQFGSFILIPPIYKESFKLIEFWYATHYFYSKLREKYLRMFTQQ